MLAYLESDHARSQSNTDVVVERWSEAVPKERLFLRPSSDLTDGPGELLRDLYDFFGVDPDFTPPEGFPRRRINSYATEVREIPARLERLLADIYEGPGA